MKKLVSILGAAGIVASGVSSVTAMSPEIKTNQSNIEKTNQVVPNLLKVIDVPNAVNVRVDYINSVIIKNFEDLSNVTATSADDKIATASIIDGSVEIAGISQGTTTVIVAANDAEDAVITVTVNEWNTIDVAKKTDVNVDEIVGLKINNFKDLVNVIVKSDNNEIATASIFDDNVVIKGKSQGTVKVTVSADYAQNATITVTVKGSKVIDVAKNATIYVNQTTELKINNFADLSNVSATSADDKIATASIIDGSVGIAGISQGTTTVIVSADNAKDAVISVTVNELKTIDVAKNAAVYPGQEVGLKINNFADLSNVSATSVDNKIATVSIIDGSVAIAGISQGTTTVIVAADNAKDAVISVTVNELKIIDVAKNAAVYPGQGIGLKINNFADLSNVSATSVDNKIATASIIAGSVAIAGVSQGTTTVIVSADNAKDAVISVTVNELKTIDVAKNTAVYPGQEVGLKINNFADLSNVTVKSDNNEIATAEIFNGNVRIKGKNPGMTKVLVSADYAKDAVINVTVNKYTEIQIPQKEVKVFDSGTIGGYEVVITNAAELTGLKVEIKNPAIATASLDKGAIKIVGNKIGKTTVKVTAENAASEKEISVTVETDPLNSELAKLIAEIKKSPAGSVQRSNAWLNYFNWWGSLYVRYASNNALQFTKEELDKTNPDKMWEIVTKRFMTNVLDLIREHISRNGLDSFADLDWDRLAKIEEWFFRLKLFYPPNEIYFLVDVGVYWPNEENPRFKFLLGVSCIYRIVE